MKSFKLYCFILFSLFFAVQTQAQTTSNKINQNAIYIGIGSQTIRGLELGKNGTKEFPQKRFGELSPLITVIELFLYIGTGGDYDPFTKPPKHWYTIKKSPALHIGYQFKENENWAFSGMFAYQNVYEKFRFEDENIPTYSRTTHYISAMARADKYWNKDLDNRIYSSLALGFSLDKNHPIAYQVCIIGTRFGTEHTKAFVEFGAGHNGIISAGLSGSW